VRQCELFDFYIGQDKLAITHSPGASELARKSAPNRKAEIIAACLDLADRMGPDRMTTNDIAQAVGLSQPGIFRHFPTKQALWLAVAEDVSRRLNAAWDHALAQADTPEARLRALIFAQLQQISATPALPMVLHSRELNIDNPALRDAFRTKLAAFQGHLVAALTQMQREARLRPSLSPADAAVFLTSLVQGLAIRWSLGARDFRLAEEGARLFEIQLSLISSETPHG
jgi:TetR/AcrR family transcriptional regulator